MSDVGMPFVYKFISLQGSDESNEARLNMEAQSGWELICITPDHRAILKRPKDYGTAPAPTNKPARKPSETK